MFISQSLAGWEVQDQGTGRFSVWWGLSSGLQAVGFLLFLHLIEREPESSLASSYINTNPIHEGSTIMSNYLLKTPPLNTTTLGVNISMYEFWRDINTQCIAFSMWLESSSDVVPACLSVFPHSMFYPSWMTFISSCVPHCLLAFTHFSSCVYNSLWEFSPGWRFTHSSHFCLEVTSRTPSLTLHKLG